MAPQFLFANFPISTVPNANIPNKRTSCNILNLPHPLTSPMKESRKSEKELEAEIRDLRNKITAQYRAKAAVRFSYVLNRLLNLPWKYIHFLTSLLTHLNSFFCGTLCHSISHNLDSVLIVSLRLKQLVTNCKDILVQF